MFECVDFVVENESQILALIFKILTVAMQYIFEHAKKIVWVFQLMSERCVRSRYYYVVS